MVVIYRRTDLTCSRHSFQLVHKLHLELGKLCLQVRGVCVIGLLSLQRLDAVLKGLPLATLLLEFPSRRET
jgi:hypothetical protein